MTVDEVLALGPCDGYSREVLKYLASGRESVPLKEILRMESVPLIDRIWLLSHKEVWPSQKQHQAWIIQFMTRAITNYVLYCEIPKYEHWAEKWLDGSDRTTKSASIIVRATCGMIEISSTPKSMPRTELAMNWTANAACWIAVVETTTVTLSIKRRAQLVYQAARAVYKAWIQSFDTGTIVDISWEEGYRLQIADALCIIETTK